MLVVVWLWVFVGFVFNLCVFLVVVIGVVFFGMLIVVVCIFWGVVFFLICVFVVGYIDLFCGMLFIIVFYLVGFGILGLWLIEICILVEVWGIVVLILMYFVYVVEVIWVGIEVVYLL